MRIKKELMQLSADLHILVFFRISRLNWNDHDNRMDRKRSQVFKCNPQVNILRGRPKNI